MKSLIFTLIALVVAQVTFACSAGFTYTTGASNNNLLQLSCTATSTAGTLPAHPLVYNTFIFGDGTSQNTSLTGSVSHNYAAAGTYTVKLITTVIDSSTFSLVCSDTAIHVVTVSYQPCDFSWTSTIGTGGSVTYTATCPAGTTGILYTWNFGDGSAVGHGSPVTHTYASNGTYTVSVYDSASGCGYVNIGSVTITNAGSGPCLGHASFTSSVSGSTASFTNTSTIVSAGTRMYSSIWSFGDGVTSGIYSPSHPYAAAGTYYALLSMTWYDSLIHSSCTDSAVQVVNISPSSPCMGHAAFTSSVSGSTASFTNTSSIVSMGTSVSSSAWSFGDGATSSSYSPSHTYATSTTYLVLLSMTWYDSLSHSSCTDSAVQMVNISPSSPCLGHAAFTSSVSGSTASFTNTSSIVSMGTSVSSSAWSFGDGVTSSSYSPSHIYATSTTYFVLLSMTWYDSLSHNSCTDSAVHTVTIPGGTPVNKIQGNITTDTSPGGNPLNPIFKVWLIKYDSATTSLSAVDSQTVLGAYYVGNYTFNNEPAGSYRVKAALTNGPTSGTAAVPTYGFDSLYWHGAHVINYSGTGVSGGNDIYMRNGTVTSGPGFVSGNVTSGANKGTQTTGIPVAGLTMFLETAAGTPIAFTTTDANGNYQFANFPAGNYMVYPEGLNYATIPAMVTAGSTQVNNTNFTEHTISKLISPNTSGVVNVTANNADLNVFPNPGTGVFNISWSSKTALQNAHAVVTDVVGREVISTDLNMNTAAGRTQLNMSEMRSGIYFINIKADGISYTAKVVLQH